jgi:hypothetical protein
MVAGVLQLNSLCSLLVLVFLDFIFVAVNSTLFLDIFPYLLLSVLDFLFSLCSISVGS